jgi:hypothetical protein
MRKTDKGSAVASDGYLICYQGKANHNFEQPNGLRSSS